MIGDLPASFYRAVGISPKLSYEIGGGVYVTKDGLLTKL